MQNGDEALSTIILACRGLWVKILVTLEPLQMFWYTFAYLYICFKLAGQMTKKRKKMLKIMVTPDSWLRRMFRSLLNVVDPM